jgi:hypothetical protein
LPPVADISPFANNGRVSNQDRYAGMTLNERLFEAGLVEAFDAAAVARNHSEMIRILMELDVDDAAWPTDMILQNPKKYGF